METARLTRQELYELVWSIPIAKLAVRFGISDVALTKRCKKLQIPTPGLGYWARIAAGQKPARKKLPKAPSGTSDAVVFEQSVVRSADAPAKPAPPEVLVGDKLGDPHPAIAWLRDALKRASPDEYGRLIVGHTFGPDVCVRKCCEARTLLIVDALFKALEARGHGVVAAKPDSQYGPERELVISVYGQSFELRIEEKLRPKPHVLTPEEVKRKSEPYYARQIRKWDQVPEGEIRIRLYRGTSYRYQGRTTWSDTKIQRLDTQLGRVVLDIEQAGEYMRAEQAAAAEQRRIYLEQERKRLRKERLVWYQCRLTEDLVNVANDWADAKRLEEFLVAYEAALNESQKTDVATCWLDAARNYARRLNPLNEPERIAKELEPSDEYLEKMIAEYNAAEERAKKAAAK